MKNVIIMGSGRSGTSMTAGILANSGYFPGNYVLNKGRINNPFGNFEDQEVNFINEQLLSQVIPGPKMINGILSHRDRPTDNQRWVGRVPVGTAIPPIAVYEENIRNLTSQKPFYFKDPRFSYTLPVWRPHLKDTVYVCVFRNPYKTAQSILKQIVDAPYMNSIQMDFSMALDVWIKMYSHILEVHRHEGEWLFLHYDQALTEMGLDKLSEFTGASVDRNFPKKDLRRDYQELPIPDEAAEIYQQLCKLADFEK